MKYLSQYKEFSQVTCFTEEVVAGIDLDDNKVY